MDTEEGDHLSRLKTKRTKIDSDSENQIDDHATLTNKERAKIHRERKKKYYEELEHKVENLQMEIQELKHKYEEALLSKCCSCNAQRTNENNISLIIQDEKCSKLKLLEEEKFMINDIPAIYENNLENLRYSMYEHSRETAGCFGTERVKVLKDAFHTITPN